jgi:glycosyltransferase involved in cell wall biosynthesis
VVVYNAVDVDAIRVREHHDLRPVDVVSVGRLAHPKDFVTLVHACARLEPGLARLTVVGDGPDRGAVESAIAETGLEGVRMLGERDDVPDLLAASDVFVLSSLSEGLPMSVLEAMAAGLPLVLTRVGGMPELVTEGENGRLVPARDPASLAAAIDGLVRDAELRRSFGTRSRERVEKTFSLSRFHDEHLSLYERLLAGRPARVEPA